MSLHVLYCAKCGANWFVSQEDPDSTLSDAIEHVTKQHPTADPIMTIKESRKP